MLNLSMARIGVPLARESQKEKEAKAARIYIARDGKGKVISCK